MTMAKVNSIDQMLKKLDKTNPMQFKRKNDFFYDNANLIIESNPIMSTNSYLDVLSLLKQNKKKSISFISPTPDAKKKINISKDCLNLNKLKIVRKSRLCHEFVINKDSAHP